MGELQSSSAHLLDIDGRMLRTFPDDLSAGWAAQALSVRT
jgi:hypothetical protein